MISVVSVIGWFCLQATVGVGLPMLEHFRASPTVKACLSLGCTTRFRTESRGEIEILTRLENKPTSQPSQWHYSKYDPPPKKKKKENCSLVKILNHFKFGLTLRWLILYPK